MQVNLRRQAGKQRPHLSPWQDEAFPFACSNANKQMKNTRQMNYLALFRTPGGTARCHIRRLGWERISARECVYIHQ